ncbi:sulfatase-like hydrolase/transferase [Lentisphaera profundi]|uniref:Sulfatase-like hydrolase/transferase n=1 Tax=Lentisphaera profundi TaxID=1658616 RepID=A0ABY7VY85_9BACT|nr:sulfatase-like hydrolase/transferase [Lentisphaera profundi]WDE98170.1 sulfatase-like hydrolase/transferase [Lentisphaera profundi]
MIHKFFVLFVVIASICSANITVLADESPNVILIYADDLGMGLLGHKGQEIITTPHIDKLAAEGMSFNNYYGNTYCAPARWSLLTGMHDGRMKSGSHTKGGYVVKLDKSKPSEEQWKKTFDAFTQKREQVLATPKHEVFLAQVAQKAGYKTAQFGKLDEGFLTWHKQLQRRGWDHYVGYYDHVRAHGFYPTYLWKNGEKMYLEGNTSYTAGKASESGTRPVGSGGLRYSQDVFLKEMLSFIRENKNKKFFLYHPTQLPHGPVAVNELHPDYEGRDDLTLSEKKYATMVKMLDDHVGVIMDELKALNLDDKTLVIFTSDNGHETYYMNRNRQLPKSNSRKLQKADGSKANFTDDKWRTSNGGDTFNGAAGMAGLKWSVFQGGIHCPMIARWPGQIEPSSKSEKLATHYDFMATLADLLHVERPSGKGSVSYLSTLLGRGEVEHHEWIFIRYGKAFASATLITEDGWKLIALKNGEFHLYKLTEDPLEENEISEKYPEILESLKKVYKQQNNSKRPDLLLGKK